MANRKIIRIDENLCNGCGVCVPSCAEGAIRIIDGKARLVSDKLCDGLGACLGECPEGALIIEEREADEFEEELVEHVKAKASEEVRGEPAACACPGARVMQFDDGTPAPNDEDVRRSELRQWPVQLHLVPTTAPYFKGADVLLAADCVAFAVGDFHKDHLRGKALAIACPKLDQGEDVYVQKLTALIDDARINTLTVMIMEVPCCGGLVRMAQAAQGSAKRKIPVKRLVVGLKGDILADDWI
ncbi:MAG: 4Fe-4S binding protein [Deltaproteobacteria bacterium]|nr:4Fe-4S binding protein [Deltaproteobacteria bacterium]